MPELREFASMFLVTNGLFFAALGAADTDNDKLKVGLSVGVGLSRSRGRVSAFGHMVLCIP